MGLGPGRWLRRRYGRRRRWALRWRTETAVRDLAEHLAWEVAASLRQILPVPDLAITIRHAILDEFAEGVEISRRNGDNDPVFFGINHQVTRTLDWLIRHNPTLAGATIGETIGDAERRGIHREVSERSFRTALALDSKLDQIQRTEFLGRVMPADK